jgi:aconitate hydratase
MPGKFLIDDSMFIFPKSSTDSSPVEIFRGPNIGAPPTNDPFPADIKGKATLKVGDKITTDHIIPAGARMKYRSNVPKYSEFVFETVDAGFSARARQIRDAGRHNIIVGGESYGEGSSREHAAICPMFLGVKVVLAKSFQRIHTDNLVNFGILPITFKNETDYERIDQNDELEIVNAAKSIANGQPLVVKNKTKGMNIEVLYGLTARQKQIILAGGSLSMQRKKAEGSIDKNHG